MTRALFTRGWLLLALVAAALAVSYEIPEGAPRVVRIGDRSPAERLQLACEASEELSDRLNGFDPAALDRLGDRVKAGVNPAIARVHEIVCGW